MSGTNANFLSFPDFDFLFSLLAPVSGLYSFTVFFVMDAVNTNLGIKVNDVGVCIGFGDRDHFGNTGTCTAMVQLAAGDLINVKIVDNGSGDWGVILGSKYSGLSGFLLEPL